ncbi:MAG: D-aminoacyl-tRNA deacylase [Candidatus Omnitrophota bacterium]
MRALIQRVKTASVSIDGKEVARIATGFLLLLGVGKDDSADDAVFLAKKIAALRIFQDPDGKMNLNIKDAKGSVLSVPQFTLFADTKKGNRPGFDAAADPQTAETLWKECNRLLREERIEVATGVFGSSMDVALVNDGPVTIWLDSKE